MMVIAQTMAKAKCVRAIQSPAMTIQMMFMTSDKQPEALCRSLNVRPNGNRLREVSLKH